LDAEQLRAIEHPLDAGGLAIVGPAGSGKTAALLQRAQRAAREGPGVLLSGPGRRAVARLRAGILALSPASPATCATLGEVALEVLQTLRPGAEVELISDVRAAQVFESVGARLFSLDWTEFVSAEIDPEITGLRAPEHFSSAAFRLIRRLRAAQISPERFRELCLKGATKFYGRPPNFAGADLLMETGPKYRDSLRVTPQDLARQHERELDLVKILVRLYTTYVESLVARGCLTGADAIYDATSLLETRGKAAFGRYRYALIDDAQDLDAGELAFLERLFGAGLPGVTFAGDEREATRVYAGARGDAALKNAATIVALTGSYRCDPSILSLAERMLEPAAKTAPLRDAAIETYRGATTNDEARYVATTAARLVRDGVAPSRIAVITRRLAGAIDIVDGLLARGVPVDLAGQASLFDLPAVQDALGALWALVDPYRHDWLLRNLEAPWLALSDATIAQLCGEPAQPQALLFEIAGDVPEESRGRWDRRRDLRLGRNVTRGDADAELPAEARERLDAFRAALARWERLERALDPPALARLILAETVLPARRDDARGRFERGLIARFLDGIDAFCRRDPSASLEDFLRYAENVADADADLLALDVRDADAVHVIDVEAAKGREFDHVFVIDARAGAFPRYYVPDAFLFTPSHGMIPKENVGKDARTARTAKFTYLHFLLKLRERYNLQERKAFYCAATRARRQLYVSASGRATRGVAAPEFFEDVKKSLPDP
jgi:superfamily I DNA/RNA helicase